MIVLLVPHCDTSNTDVKHRVSKLFVRCPSLDPFMDSLLESGIMSLPLREGMSEGSLFDFAYSVASALETLTIMNDISWPRNESPFFVGFFGSLSKLGVKIFPPTLIGDEKTLVNQGLPATTEKRIMVPMENQIFSYAAFALVANEFQF